MSGGERAHAVLEDRMVCCGADVYFPEFQGLVAGDTDTIKHWLAPVDKVRPMFADSDLRRHIGKNYL